MRVFEDKTEVAEFEGHREPSLQIFLQNGLETEENRRFP